MKEKTKKEFKETNWLYLIMTILLTGFLTLPLTKACDVIVPDKYVLVGNRDTLVVISPTERDMTGSSQSDTTYAISEIKVARKTSRETSADHMHEDRLNLPMKTSFPNAKGYIPTEGGSYFTLTNSPSFTAKEIDFYIKLLSPKILDRVYCLNVKIIKNNNSSGGVMLMDQAYEVLEGINHIRISNTLKTGNYSVSVGLHLKEDKDAQYPVYYRHEITVSI